jgi:hypothetical protein
MKFILAILGINAANKAASDERGQLAVLSLVGLILFVYIAALVRTKRNEAGRLRDQYLGVLQGFGYRLEHGCCKRMFFANATNSL